jgi:hypothetical protein
MAIAAVLDAQNKVINRVIVNFVDDVPGAVDGTTADIGDIYDQVTKTFSRPAEKIAAQASRDVEVQRVSDMINAVKNDNALNALRSMSPAQIDNYFTNNVTDLPAVINLLKKLVKLLARNL